MEDTWTGKRGRDAADLAMSLQTKRAFLGDVNPGREYKEPRIYQEPRHEEPSSAGEVRA
jgi:hypothetical protein